MNNKDFYNNLPGCVAALLDDMEEKYKGEVWLPKAWEEYRQHVLHSEMEDMRMPGFVFNKYLNIENNDEEAED